MYAAILMSPNQMKLTQIETPKAGPGELVLKVRAATICGTDIRIYRGRKAQGIRYPSIIGHEFAGEIADIGREVGGFHVNDAVAVNPDVPCGDCAYCKVGQDNLCLNVMAIGYHYNGAFAEYIKIPAKAVADGNVHKMPSGITFEHAALIEPLACCVNGQERGRVGPGDTVVILGGGAIGMMHLQLAKAAGARHVLVSEPNKTRRHLAEQLGADSVCDPTNTDVKIAVDGITAGLGADAVIIAIGIPTLVGQALNLARKGGRITLFAGFSDNQESNLDVNLIHYNELIVTGSSGFTRRHFDMALQLVLDGKLRTEELVTHRFPLSEIDDAFTGAETGVGLKVAVKNE
jgi:L-iditol 2-dehydrogenase